jgi:hypothetical protein
MTAEQREQLARDGAELLATYGRAPQADAVTDMIRENDRLRLAIAQIADTTTKTFANDDDLQYALEHVDTIATEALR